MQKTLIATTGVGNSGKTNSLKLLRKMLLKKSNVSEISFEILNNQEEDFISFLKMDNILICITSQGDTPYLMEKPLKKAVNQTCDIIVCACRSYGDTVDIIKRICRNYKKVWITKNRLDSDTNEDALRKRANKSSAKLLLNIIETL